MFRWLLLRRPAVDAEFLRIIAEDTKPLSGPERARLADTDGTQRRLQQLVQDHGALR